MSDIRIPDWQLKSCRFESRLLQGTILIKIVSGVVVTERITWMKKSIYLLTIDYEKELSIHTICANLFKL
jgi:hypothetical protein